MAARRRMELPAANRSGGWLRRTIDFLGSGRLAVVLLLTTSAILYLYLVIPQRGQVEERVLLSWVEIQGAVGRGCHALGLTDVLHSWPFWGIYGLLLLNLTVCLTRRLPIALRLWRFPDRPPRPASGWLEREVAAPELRPEQVARQLRKRGYRTLIAEGSVYALRGRFAAIGHWVFHLGLLALLVAGGWLAAARDPFRGTVGVGEGESFDLGSARFVSSNQEVDSQLPPLRFRLDRVALSIQAGAVRGLEATLAAPDETRAEIGINRPYRSAPYQVMAHGFGYMPGWGIANARGRVVKGAWVKLLPFPLEGEDGFSLGPPESRVTVRFYPDHRQQGEADRTLSQELRNPRFRATVTWRGSEVYAGLLEPGERVRLDGDREFFFLPEIRRYGLLDVIEEQGQAPVFAGFGIVIAGLLLRYARLRKEIVVQFGPASLQLYGRGEIFEHLFAEDLDRLVAELMNPGRAPGDRRGAA